MCGGKKINKSKGLILLTAITLVIQYMRSAAKKIGHPGEGKSNSTWKTALEKLWAALWNVFHEALLIPFSFISFPTVSNLQVFWMVSRFNITLQHIPEPISGTTIPTQLSTAHTSFYKWCSLASCYISVPDCKHAFTQEELLMQMCEVLVE